MAEVDGGKLALGLIMLLVLTPIGFFLFIIPGVIFLAVSIYLIVTAFTEPSVTRTQPPQPGYTVCPHCAGQNYPTARHCQWCGKPLQGEAEA